MASLLEVCVSSLESTLSSNNTCNVELELPLASKHLEFDVAAAELQSTKRSFPSPRMLLFSCRSSYNVEPLCLPG